MSPGLLTQTCPMNPLRRTLSLLRTTLARTACKNSRSKRIRLSPLQLETRECPATNLISNPSVETPGTNASLPLAWHSDHYGNNVETFTYSTTGFDGQRSLRVDMTSQSSGDAKWYFDDVPVTPGQKYTYSDLYTSDVSTSATVRYRMTNGSYSYIGYYPTAAASNPTNFTFDFTAPAGVVSATILHLIRTKGYLATDAFSLVQSGAPTPDTSPPTVSVTSPTANSSASGTITLAAQASDNVGVAGVHFLVDGNPIGAEDTTSPYQVSLNTTTLTDGSHSITAIARDAAGNSTTSAAVALTVANADTIVPAVSITSPAASSTVSGSINLTAQASDNVGVVGVSFIVDGSPFGSEVTTAPYQISLNTTTLTDGSHSITAIARDAAGNSATATAVVITVANADTSAPAVSVSSPTQNASVSGTITLAALASDNIGVVGVRFLVDGNPIGAEDTTSPYEVSLNTATLTDGNHSITAIARDAAGNSTTSAAVAITVANADVTAPSVSVNAPIGNATVSGTISLTAQANDNVGVAGVRFLVDGNPIGLEVATAPFQISLDTTTLINGTHSITAIARDAAGNSTTSSAITVAVDNSPVPTPTNLIQNPSVELLGSNGDPAGWTRNSWGANSPTFTLVAGTDGARAVRVELSSYSSGDAKWVFDSVPVTPNTNYTFSVAYRSNIGTKMVIQYRLADGTLSYVFVASVSAASNWSNASYQITTPANAAAMTVFHLIEGIGWLETDKFSLSLTGGGGGSSGPGMISMAFDDGWLSQLQNAVPLLQQANLPATFYIVTRANQGGASWEEVPNHSFETAAADGSPLGWRQWQTGTNTAAFTYATVGSDGTRSGRVDVSSYTSGDDAWYFQDIAVQPGTSYTISHQYNANVSTSVFVRFTLHNGSVSYVDRGSLAATNGQWQTQQFTITAPANADAMTVVHRISLVGSLAIDNFSVKEVSPYSNPDYMTPAQIQSLAAAGFEIGAHTLTHADLTGLSAAGALAQIDGSRADLAALGINATTFAYPYGDYNTAIEQVVAADGFVAARTVNDGTNTGATDHFALMHHEVDLDTTVADVQGWINTAVQTKTWLILTFHQIDNSGEFYSATPSTLQQIVNLVSSSGLTPVTVAQGVAKI